MKKIVLIGCFLLGMSQLIAQVDFDLKTAVDTTQLRIGEQLNYSIQLKSDSILDLTFAEKPIFAPFELLEESPLDTIQAQGHYLFTKKYALIQFDSGAYWLPSQKIGINGSLKITDSLLIEVATVVVDTLKQKLYDIKPIVEVEKNNERVIKSILLGVLVVLLLIGIIYAFFFAKKRIEQKKKKLPPFERAIEELKALESIKPTDQEEHKNYYSRLTDVIRRYLEEEAKISALESTSDELLSKLELLKDSGKLKLEHDTIKNLKSVLQTADLVKFARSMPDQGISSRDRILVEEVVIETKEALPEPTPEEIREREEYQLILAKQRKRKQIKWSFASLGIAAIISLSIAIYVYGFYPVRDTILGNPTVKLKMGEWVTSQYGTPPVKISTPKVLKRIKVEGSGMQRFSIGSYDSPFYLDLIFKKTPPNPEKSDQDEEDEATEKARQKEKIQQLVNEIIQDFQSRGAVNILIKEEEVTTLSGLPALKIFGTLDYPKKGDDNRVRCNYTTHIFDFESGGITMTILYEKEDRYADKIEERIMNSFELIKEL